MVTLHSYVLRELLKTFGLALAALSVLFTMGGGLYNVVRFEGVSAGDVLAFVPMLLPVVVTLTMPMAALFAATMVYGRLAADNELLACRAAGLNVHKLFLSVGLLAVFVAAFTLLVGNFVIPGFVHGMEDFARRNLRDLFAQQLQHKGFVHRGKTGEDRYTVTAERVEGVSPAALQGKGFEVADGLHYLLLTSPTFLSVNAHGDLWRFMVARHVLCVFDTRASPLAVTLHVRDGWDFEVGKSAAAIAQQQFGPLAVPIPTPFRMSFADLRWLWRWRQRPWEVPRFKDEVAEFVADLQQQRFGAWGESEVRLGWPLLLRDEYGQHYRVEATAATATPKNLALQAARVTVSAPDGQPRTTYEAERAELNSVVLPTSLLIEIKLVQTATQDVLEYDHRAGRVGSPRRKPTLSLDQVLVPGVVLAELAAIDPAVVLDPSVDLALDATLADRRLGLQRAGQHVQRKLTATINFRLGCALSVLVTLFMGAALGVVFRGARALAAFALALIPFFSVMILLMLGRQLTEDALLTRSGPLVTWGGLLLVLLADGVMLRLGVRR